MKQILLKSMCVLAVGCSTSPQHAEPVASLCGGKKCDDITAVSPLAIQCSVDQGTVRCASVLSPDYPASVELTMFTIDGSVLANLSNGDAFAVPVGTQVMISARAGSTQRGLFSADGDSDRLDLLNQTVTLNGPLQVELPFDLWPVTISGTGIFANADLEPQTLPIAPWKTFLHNRNTVTRSGAPLPLFHNEPISFAVLVARGAAVVRATAQICDSDGCEQNVPVELTGPGEYVLQNRSLVKDVPVTHELDAGTADAASIVVADAGVEVNQDLDAGTADAGNIAVVDAGVEVNADTGPIDLDPTCGGESQRRCNVDGSFACDEGFVYRSSENVCRVCGGEGEPRCALSDGSFACDEGFVYRSSENVCRVCGGEGEPRCALSDGSFACDEGFVYRSSENVCRVCGGEGEPRCALSDGSFACDEGFVYRSSESVCRAAS